MAKAEKSKSTKKLSLKERVKAKKEELKNRSSRSNVIRQKDEGTIRVRIMQVGEDKEFYREVINFWLNNDLGSITSPQTIGQPCAAYEKYQELKESDDEMDMELAKKLTPRTKPVIPIIYYDDLKGKKVNSENSGKLLQISTGVLQEILDLYLDDDDWGDMTDPKKGYDIKITREGKGRFDTNYTVQPCKNTPVPKEFRKPVDLDELVKAEIDSFDTTLDKVNKWLDSSPDTSDDDDDAPKKKKSKKSSKDKKSKTSDKKKKSKKRSKDI